MSEGLSGKEIAAKMFVCAGTISSHSNNMFRKLKVHNRVQAINKGRELGIIE